MPDDLTRQRETLGGEMVKRIFFSLFCNVGSIPLDPSLTQILKRRPSPY